MLGPGRVKRCNAFTLAPYRLSAGGRGVGSGAVGQIAVGDVGAARGWRVVVVVVQAQRVLASDGLGGGADALAVGVSSQVVGAFRVERTVAEERSWALVALLLQPLRAHGPEKAVGRQWDVGSACRRCGPALVACAYASGSAGAAVEGSSPAPRWPCLRPSSIPGLCG